MYISLEIKRLREEIDQWKQTSLFWQNRHDNFLTQVKKVSEDMERLKTDNDTLIFVNKELGRMNEELREELDHRRSSSRLSSSHQTDLSEYDDEQPRPRKKPKQKAPSSLKKKESKDSNDDAARVCKFSTFIYNVNFTKFFFCVIDRDERNTENITTRIRNEI
jgi:uncharacterized coiled-coil DUF342 family protein